MGLSGQSQAQKDYNRANQSLLNNQKKFSNAILPDLTSATTSQLKQNTLNANNPVYDWMRTQSNQLTGSLPQWQQIGLDNPQVKQFADIYNQNTDALMKQYGTAASNQSAANQDFGSSYRAGQQAALGDAYNLNKSDNILKALKAATDLQNSNQTSWWTQMQNLLSQPQYTMPNLASSTAGYNPRVSDATYGQQVTDFTQDLAKAFVGSLAKSAGA